MTRSARARTGRTAPALARAIAIAIGIGIAGAAAAAPRSSAADEGSRMPEAATATGDAAAREPPEAARLRETLAAEARPDARARKLVALGPDAWAILLEWPSLATLADELVEPALAAATDEQLAAIAARLSEVRPSLLGRLARRMVAPPRAPLLGPLAAFSDDADDDTALDAGDRAGELLAEAALLGGTSAFELLLFGPESVTGAARMKLVVALGRSGRPDTIEALAPLLTEDAEVAAVAAQALEQCPEARGAAIDPLVRALAAPDPMVRRAAAGALGRLRATEALDPLLALLADPEANRPSSRPAAGGTADGPGRGDGAPDRSEAPGDARAPGAGDEAPPRGDESGHPSGAPPPPLPPGAIVMTAQNEALRALREIACDPRLPDDPAAARAFVAERRAESDRKLPVLLAEVESGEPTAAVRAARILPRHAIRRDRIRPVLLRMLRSSDAATRALAASALGALRDPLAVPALIDGLADRDPEVWEAAHAALRTITGKNIPAKAEAWRRRNMRR